MRLFLGIDLPQQTKEELYAALLPLRKHHSGFRWVEPKNYHVTVQFFGEVSSPEDILKRLKDILYDAKTLYMYTFHLDTYVNKSIEIYLDFYRQKELEKIAATVRADLGVEEKHEFHPHITVSRSSLSSKQQFYALEKEIDKLKINLEFKVDKLVLFESILTAKDPQYKAVDTFKLP